MEDPLEMDGPISPEEARVEGWSGGSERRSEEKKRRPWWLKWVIAGAIAIIIAFCALGVYTVDQTEEAVIKEFGKFVGTAEPGIHWRNPLTQSVEIYYVGVRTVDFVSKEEMIPATASAESEEIATSRLVYPSIVVLSKDALEIRIDLSVATKIRKDKLEEIAKTFKNQDYLEQWKIATIRSAVRDVISQYDAEEIYGSKRSEVEASIHNELEKRLSQYFDVTGVYLRKIELPTRLKDAIEAKLQAQQEAQRMQYILEKEKREAERKQVEAEGIAKANQIIGESRRRNQEYVQWYYLQVLQKFADSEINAIIIVTAPSNCYPGVNLTEPVAPPIILPQQ